MAAKRAKATHPKRSRGAKPAPALASPAVKSAMRETPEHLRIREIHDDLSGWRRWGPYVSDRAWGTVREDYSATGDAWNHLPHDLARSKAYRWGEDGLAGLCDRYQLFVFAPAFWNGSDPILKERLFGLTPFEGNHGEDVKEYYFYLDNVPSHAYMKFLYKYPQRAFPYADLVRENQRRNGEGFEFELVDTGIFDDDRYFDIFVEYAKIDPEDIAIKIEAHNRGKEPAPLHILPHLWFRNTWAWSQIPRPEPVIRAGQEGQGFVSLVTDDSMVEELTSVPVHYVLGPRTLYAQSGCTLLFTDNETNMPRVFGPGHSSRKRFQKDAFHRHLIGGEACVNPDRVGTKAALHYQFDAVPPGGSVSV
ncbi:MAG TPA: glucosidase, partial [Isosphaeraceae bacterium]|nr:glucosidase [Isosphaeraceae bacterium]